MNYKTLARLGGSLALALLSLACDDSDAGNQVPDGGADAASLTCPAGGTAQLNLALVVPCDVVAPGAVGAPAVPVGPGCTGTVTLTAAGAFSPRVHLAGGGLATPVEFALGQPLTVPAGPGYSLQGKRVTTHPAAGSAGIVGQAFTPTLPPFGDCLRAGEIRTVTVAYALEPGSEKLWLTTKNGPAPLAAFGPAALAATGAAAPTNAGFNHTNQATDLALDARGNLWVVGSGNPEKVVMYPMETLGSLGASAPAVVLTGAAVPRPRAIAFDDAGNLWVGNGGTGGAITQIAATALLASGQPVPLTTITSPSVQAPEALAFDAEGNLWVASSGNDSVLKFNKARLAANDTGAADVVLTSAQVNASSVVTYSYRSPQSLAFDRLGNLWVGFWAGSHIVRLVPGDLAVSKRVDNPLFKQTVPQASLVGLALDEQGGLWFPTGPSQFARLAPEALAAPGSSPAERVITVTGPLPLGSAVKLLFNPTPAGLPIR